MPLPDATAPDLRGDPDTPHARQPEGRAPLWPIRTRVAHAPWRWVAMLCLPWSAMIYIEQLSNVAITFKLREFVSAPLLITLLGSFNLLFNVFVGATCNYASDRVWTPLGRRKPFLLAGWAAIAVGCVVLPEIGTLWLLVGLLFLYEMLRDAATPYESLCNEVVPPHQRGRANAAFTFARNGMIAVFFYFLIGRWDDVIELPGLGAVSGQHLVFWTGAALALAVMAFLHWGVRETPPPNLPAPWPRPTARVVAGAIRGFLRDVFGNRTWRALFAVAVAQMIFWIDFGSLAPLLYTEQWGFEKQTYGNLLALATLATLFVFLPVGGWLADRADRVTMFKLFAAAMTLNHLALFLYVKLVAEGGVPAFNAVLAFKLVGTGVGTIGTVCSVSLIFDYVPRDRLGTVLAGVGIVRGLAQLAINNGIGAWVTLLAWLGHRATAPDGTTGYDYASGYLYLVACGLLATAVAFWFGRQTQSGELVKQGVLEAEAATPDPPQRPDRLR